MQTFLPYADFRATAETLDRQRLGKQRVEGVQILKALTDRSYGWQNHPAVRMWRGYGLRLAEYVLVICDEWIERGYRDSCRDQVLQLLRDRKGFGLAADPPWLGNEDFHTAHQSNLVRKSPDYYRVFFPGSISAIMQPRERLIRMPSFQTPETRPLTPCYSSARSGSWEKLGRPNIRQIVRHIRKENPIIIKTFTD